MNLKRHKQFLKDWNKSKLTDGQFTKFIEYSECLRLEKPLPEDSKDHSLQGEYKDCREFHLGGDMLVIYIPGENDTVFLRLGTHSQLFK
jgi:mRNA interferase YafQ